MGQLRPGEPTEIWAFESAIMKDVYYGVGIDNEDEARRLVKSQFGEEIVSVPKRIRNVDHIKQGECRQL